jgi:hypothetical protein
MKFHANKYNLIICTILSTFHYTLGIHISCEECNKRKEILQLEVLSTKIIWWLINLWKQIKLKGGVTFLNPRV